MITFLTVLCLLWANAIAEMVEKPNIFFIMADDMGFDDISIHGSDQIPTPNIDAILSYGISLNRYYSAPMCTPARASLLTGKYPSQVGMQHIVVMNFEPWGLSLKDKLMPEYFKEAGYDTHLVGKWHLGSYEERRTPVHRGFDSFFGCYHGWIDYYNHTADCLGVKFPCENGYDMRDNVTPATSTLGNYSTTLFTDVAIKKIHDHNQENPLFMYLAYTAPHAGYSTDPLQVPEEVVERFNYISDPGRRKYAAMVSVLDDSIGRVVQAIDDTGMLKNSVIVFVSDNGAPIQEVFKNSGSNFPFRGQKNGPWEGAVHVSGGIWSPYLEHKQRASDQLMHISDWLPTLASVAGISLEGLVEGHNMWPALSKNQPSPREEVLLNVDSQIPYSAYIYQQFKYINGTTSNGLFDGWLSEGVDRTEGNFSPGYAPAVASSTVGRALAQFSQRKLPYILNEDKKDGAAQPMSFDEINSIRQQSQFTCNGVPTQTHPQFQCNPLQGACLFDLVADPCERRNLISEPSSVLTFIENRVKHFTDTAQAPRNAKPDPCSNPAFFNNMWVSWYDLPRPEICNGIPFVKSND